MAELEWYEIVGRLVLASVLGALVGLERESVGQDAGFRTHLMVALGAAMFAVVSVGAFDQFMTDDPTNVRIDVSRIASYVAAGVGFIGGGVILKHAGNVRGITTATSLWTAAAIGLAAGVGFWIGAVTATVISLIALAALKPLSDWIVRRSRPARSLVVIIDQQRRGAAVLETIQQEVSAPLRSMHLGAGEADGSAELAVQFWQHPDEASFGRISQRLIEEYGDEIRSISLRS